MLKKFMVLPLALLAVATYSPSAQSYYKNVDTSQYRPASIRSNNSQTAVYRSQRRRSTTVAIKVNSTSSQSKANMFASDAKSRNTIRAIFSRVNLSQNNENSRYGNSEYDDSKIRFRSLVTHRCFEPIGIEINRCKKRYGEFYNFKESILNGSIYKILVANNPDVSGNIKKLYEKMVAEIRANNAPPLITASQKAKVVQRDRMQSVWQTCKEKNNSHRAAAVCYMQYSRLYLDNELLSENPKFLQ